MHSTTKYNSVNKATNGVHSTLVYKKSVFCTLFLIAHQWCAVKLVCKCHLKVCYAHLISKSVCLMLAKPAPVPDSFAFFLWSQACWFEVASFPVESLGRRLTLQGGCALNYCSYKAFGGTRPLISIAFHLLSVIIMESSMPFMCTTGAAPIQKLWLAYKSGLIPALVRPLSSVTPTYPS